MSRAEGWPQDCPRLSHQGTGIDRRVEEAIRQEEQIMGLPVLNFKFLPDRCHWGRNSEHLPPEKEGVAEARPSLFKAATCFSFQSGTDRAVVPAHYSLQNPDATSLPSRRLFASIRFHITDEDQRG